jgi:TonB-dependent receptor
MTIMRTTKTLLLGACALGALAMAGGARAADAAATVSDLTEVVVTAPRQEVEARQVQRAAPNLVTVQSAESIAKYPDFNAAESLGRLPGVSLSSDTGEGRFINIRGIDGNLAGATFGGVTLLNTNPGGTYFSGGGRAVEFDTIPNGAIDGLVVTYTGLPDHEAEGLGGSVELTPRSAANINRPFVDAAAGWGYEPAHRHDGPTNFDLAAGVRFGFADGRLLVAGRGDAPVRAGFFSNPMPFSIVLTGSSRMDRRGFDDLEADPNDPGTSDRSYQDYQLRRYDYHRERFGGGGEIDFQPNDDHSWYLRANVAGYIEAVKKNRLTFDDFEDYGQIRTAGGGFSTQTDLKLASTDERETHRNDIYVAGGKDRFGDIVLDYRASYTEASFDVDKNYGGSFNGPKGAAFTYNNVGDNGDFPILKITDGTDPDNAALYKLKSVSNSLTHDLDRENAYAANLLFPVHLFGDDSIKIGGQARLRYKSQDQLKQSISISGSTGLTRFSNGAVTDFYDGRYTNGPDVDTLSLRAAAEAGAKPAVENPSGYFNAREFIYAGYAQYQTTIGPWGLLAGVRVESTDAAYGSYVFDGDGANLGFAVNPKRYTNAFPTVQLRYQVSPQFLIRATYSTGIARPGFNQVTGAVTIDTLNDSITTGNPNLRPTTGNMFDLDAEYYLPGGGIIQIGAFDKEFTDYIVTRNTKAPDARIPDFPLVNFQTFSNVSDAWARGVQASYHQQFSMLPGWLKGFGIDSNVTLVDSHIEEYDAATSAAGKAEFGLLPGTAKTTANAAAFYEAHGAELRLSTQYVGRQLFSLGGSKASDTIEDERTTLDFAASYRITPMWQVYFNARNLTNAPLRFYMGDPSFPIQREFYDATYEAGVKFHF